MLHMHPEMMVATYELLRTTKPFKGWKLPHADAIKFVVCRDRTYVGMCENSHTLYVSSARCAHLSTLVMTMAHEMIHMHEYRLTGDLRTKHGAMFKKFAAQVCRHHGFDPAAF